MSNDYLEEEIFDLRSRVEELEKQLASLKELKELIPNKLIKRLKDLEEKTEELESSIDDLSNS